MRLRAIPEPTFEPPPRLSWPVERRLSARAVAVWQAACRDGRPPTAATFARSELALFCAESSVGLDADADAVNIATIGATVAAAFGLVPGKLTASQSPFAAGLCQAFGELREVGAPVSFEASLAGREGGVVLLTRGVLLPLLDEQRGQTQALAIMTWKQTLGDAARDGLRGEIDEAIATARAGCRSPGLQPATSLYAVFAR